MSLLYLYTLLFLLNSIVPIYACPQLISEICRCEDLHNGVKLDCSNVDAKKVIQLIRDNQANLGLIQELSLHNANLKHIPPGYFTGLYIKKLDISFNQLEDLDPNAFLGMNSILQELILHHNNFTSLPALSLTPLNTLHRLDLSNNSITDLLPTNILPPLPKLYDLNLADNEICEVHKSVFDHVKNSLQTLNFGRNCLKAVPASAIRGFKKLMALHLHGNNITALNPLSFMNLPSLNLLNLASNKIITVHRQAFLNVPSLRYLYLTRNKITEIHPHQFNSFEHLEMLDFSSNYLLEIVTDAFSNLQNLRQLYLGDNRITNIQANSFANSSVVILALSSNRLTELKEGMFEGMVKLQQVSFKDNQIHSIDQNVFYNCPSLVMIDLSENDLTDLAPTTFLTQINILLIDLSKNKLIRTPYRAFNRRTKTVLLQENPLVCTEKIHMLQDGVGVYIPNSEDVICGPKQQPTELILATNEDRQKEVIKLNEEELLVPTNPQDQQISTPEIRTEQKIHPPVIRPLFKNTDKSTQSSEPPKLGGKLITIRPINAHSSIQSNSKQLEDKTHLEQENLHKFENAEVVASRSRGNFGLTKPKTHLLRELEKNDTKAKPIIKDQTTLPDDTNRIYPLPIPFLNSPTPLAEAFATSTPTTTQTTLQTLPANIVVAQVTFPPPDNQIVVGEKKIEKLELGAGKTDTNKNNHAEPSNEAYENDGYDRSERISPPTIIMIVCLSTVAIVMSAVFIGLCVAKHKTMRLYGDSSSTSAAAARTSAYVAAQAAQAAQMNMLYGTAHCNRSGSSLNYIDDNHAWIYAPGTYNQTCYK